MTQFLPHFTILLLKLRPRIAGGSRLGLYYGCSLGIIRVYSVWEVSVNYDLLLVWPRLCCWSLSPMLISEVSQAQVLKVTTTKCKLIKTNSSPHPPMGPTDYEMRFIKAWPLSFPVCDLSSPSWNHESQGRFDKSCSSCYVCVVMMTWWLVDQRLDTRKCILGSFLHSSFTSNIEQIAYRVNNQKLEYFVLFYISIYSLSKIFAVHSSQPPLTRVKVKGPDTFSSW